MVKFFEGKRVWPGGVHPLVVLKNAMHSIASNARKRELLVVEWADGVRGGEARAKLGWDEKRHDAVRKRLLRRLAEFDPDRRKT